jgi:hypothetical protein
LGHCLTNRVLSILGKLSRFLLHNQRNQSERGKSKD